ncbi:fatty acyl-CoA reductase 1-like [Phymastichus coffea]|uniref:fatty acyl-CoA reductase 1-like n=1 Tax=Phymastichus coffea TaxID=108790 RepID=UPI00273B5252|nr:fatty acyl-CoA reductase 1-like [Phymastichus coffea]
MVTAMDEIYRHLNDDSYPPEIDWSDSNIQKFFAGKTLFLTGATGYMGKVFLEKVIRDCPDLKRLYILVRQKKGVTPQDKIKTYFQNTIFDNLRSINPEFEEKVCTVTGDLEKDRLALSDDDRRALVESVDIIVHNGATTKFDEKVSVSLKINVLGTKHMLDLATECKRIQAFLYVSTAYSHCYRKNIEEEFYDPPGDLKMIYDMIAADESAKHGLTEDVLKILLGEYPNVYCFSKAIAEDLVSQYGQRVDFAMAVYRPSVITAAIKEPMPGWIGNNNGPALIFLGSALGIIHVSYHKNYPIDFIPVDYSINSIIAIIYDLAVKRELKRQAVVYNYGSSTLNPITLKELFDALMIEGPHIGSVNIVWYPFQIFCHSKWKFWIGHFFLAFIPAILADLALLCMGQKPRALQLFWFGTKNLDKIDYFGNGNWKIHPCRTMELYDSLNETDQAIFDFDIRKVDWPVTVITYARGGRLHILKEPLDNRKKALKHYHRMRHIHYAVIGIVTLMAIYLATRLLFHLYNVVA